MQMHYFKKLYKNNSLLVLTFSSGIKIQGLLPTLVKSGVFHNMHQILQKTMLKNISLISVHSLIASSLTIFNTL